MIAISIKEFSALGKVLEMYKTIYGTKNIGNTRDEMAEVMIKHRA